MDRVLARRLDEDQALLSKIKELADGYVQAGLRSVEYYYDDFDAALDLYNCYSSLTRNDLENLDKSNPKRYILPMSATQAVTATSFLASVLFGEKAAHKVEARENSDERTSDIMNMLCRWNAEQQPTYLIGWNWCLDAWLYNRGVVYEHWTSIYDISLEEVTMEDPEEMETVEVPVEPKSLTGKMVQNTVQALTGEEQTRKVERPRQYSRFKKVRKEVGGFTKMVSVDPYHFISDPMFPLYRFNEGRFAGHLMPISWQELKRRSELEPEHPEFVRPEAVDALKDKSEAKGTLSSIPKANARGSTSSMMSPSKFQREGGAGGKKGTVSSQENKDGGVLDVWVLRVKISPKEYSIYDDDTDIGVWEILFCQDEVLSINEDVHKHDEFPYMIGEARPSVHRQFSPSWQLMIKPLQDHIDYLKDRHEDALSRTVGNVFVGDPTLFDFDEFTNPETEGEVIPLRRPLRDGESVKNSLMQIPVADLTKDFWKEINMLIDVAESTSGANSVMQGEIEKNTTATQSMQAQKFSSGRLMSVARLLSGQGPLPQTRRVVMNFQQWMPDEMIIRLKGDDIEYRPQFRGLDKNMTIRRDDLQGRFDVVPVDLAIPGTDAKAVAAIMEVIKGSKQFSDFFDPTVDGNFDLKAMVAWAAKKSGAPMDNFFITQEMAQENLIKLMTRKQLLPPMPTPNGGEGGNGSPAAPGGNEPPGEDFGLSPAPRPSPAQVG